MKKDAYRHGDVILIECEESQIKGEEQKHLVLAEGETTGHLHEIVSGMGKLLKYNDKMYLKIQSDISEIDHPEHGKHPIAKGDYEVLIQEQSTPLGWRKVYD